MEVLSSPALEKGTNEKEGVDSGAILDGGGDSADAPDATQLLENGASGVDLLDILSAPVPEGLSSDPSGGEAPGDTVDLFGDFNTLPQPRDEKSSGDDFLDFAAPSTSAEGEAAPEMNDTSALESSSPAIQELDPPMASTTLQADEGLPPHEGEQQSANNTAQFSDPAKVTSEPASEMNSSDAASLSESNSPGGLPVENPGSTGASNGSSGFSSEVESKEEPRSANEEQQQAQEISPKQTEGAVETVAPRNASELEGRIQELEAQVAGYEAKLSERQRQNEETTTLLMEIQESLQQQMSAKAEAENKSRLLESKMKDLEQVNNKQSKELADMADLQSVLQEHMEAKAEAEQKSRSSLERLAQLEAEIQPKTEQIQALERELARAQQLHAAQAEEVAKIRAERDEQHRKEQSLTSRLNAAKKEQGEQSNLAERLEDEIKALEQDLESTRKELSEVSHAKVLLENELEVLKKTSENRLKHTEVALLDERNLNEERKRKMKLFVESKSEELRQAKADNDSLQSELAQTNKSLVDLNNRWKQLHAQWVQSQTRNRELQRDLNRIKKDSENLHKVGDTLEMKLSRSATETEEHKSKRLAAKHELMTVLRTLEFEREVTARLRDSLKFSFTPKALSQQQLLSEGLRDFEAQLQKLALRLGRPLPGAADGDASNNSDGGDLGDSALYPDPADVDNGASDDAVLPARTDAEIQRLIAKLEHETQRVSRGIMALSGNIERMHLLLDASGDRTCYTVLSEFLTTGAVRPSSGSSSTPEETRRLGTLRSSHQYGQIPGSLRD